jgi:hypothetical protein
MSPGIKSASPSNHFVVWDITFKLSSQGIKFATPVYNNVEWDLTLNFSS